ncbi:MAG TPA: DNA polymerase III subunit epsilon [Afifellaceae bacterium]|nr:DNA polymerase III subunit epsilon [Afifellaceae bacterium]
MREIIFDTETTGLDAAGGDRLVEIGCVELFNHIPTGETFHRYINPERPVHPEALAVHGLDNEFLADKPVFAQIAEDFVSFLGDSPLIAHNATFDKGFINMEFARCGLPECPDDRFVDTLLLARRRHPGSPNSLDALCARYNIDNSSRTLHGALLDAEILAEVYIELIGGRQTTFALSTAAAAEKARGKDAPAGARPEPLPPRLTAAELEKHRDFVAGLVNGALWNRIRPADPPETV